MTSKFYVPYEIRPWLAVREQNSRTQNSTTHFSDVTTSPPPPSCYRIPTTMPTITTTVTSAQATGAVTTVTTTEATPEVAGKQAAPKNIVHAASQSRERPDGLSGPRRPRLPHHSCPKTPICAASPPGASDYPFAPGTRASVAACVAALQLSRRKSQLCHAHSY